VALRTFNDEDDFRQNWIKPFLHKLGYILVTHSHGADEHGRDLFFADFDRFEHPRFCAVQAKKGNIRAGNAELSKLQEQAQACFDVCIRDRKGSEEQRCLHHGLRNDLPRGSGAPVRPLPQGAIRRERLSHRTGIDWSGRMAAHLPGAQTGRRGGAGPVRPMATSASTPR